MKTFAFGVGMLALLLGFLVGASSSPVAGVAVTAGFGLVAAAVAYIQSSAIGDPSDQPDGKADKAARSRSLSIATLNTVGRVLILFSVAFALGITAGFWARVSTAFSEPAPVEFPWTADSPPASARQAIDWILVQRHLRRFGYTPSQVAELYRFAAAADKRGNPLEPLLSPLFVQQQPLQQRADSGTISIIAENPRRPRDHLQFDIFGPSSPLPLQLPPKDVKG